MVDPSGPRPKPVLLLHECRLPEGGHSGHEGGLSQCCAVGDKLIEKLHTDCELSDDPQAAHIQYVQRVLIERTGSKQAESSLKFHNQVWPFFRSGRMKALFNSGEKSANLSEVLTMSVSTGVSSSRQSLRMDVGIGSRAHDLLGEDIMIFRTSS